MYVTCNIFLNYIKTKCARKIKKKEKITLKKHVKKYENRTEYNKNWPYIPDHPYRILIIGGLGSGKTNALLNQTLINYICMLKIRMKQNINI